MKKITSIFVIIFAFIANNFAQNCHFSVDTSTININCGDSTQLKSFSTYNFALTSPTPNFILSNYFTSSTTGYLAGGTATSGFIYKTIDAGVTWDSLSLPTSDYKSDILFTSPDTGYAVGGNSIIKTTNAGTSWSVIYSGLSGQNFSSICFTDANTAYVAGDSGVILKTTNAGATWLSLANNNPNYYLNSIFFTDANTGYIVGFNTYDYSGIILKTTNAGSTWVTMLNDFFAFYSVFFTDSNNGYAAGSNGSWGTLFKTSDSGITWNLSYDIGGTEFYSVNFIDDKIGFVGGTNGLLSFTLDAGTHWTQLSTGAPGVGKTLYDINFVDNHVGYIVGENGLLLKLGVNDANYDWQPYTSISNPASPTPFASPTTTTTYNLTITPNINSGCTPYIKNLTINVNPLTAFCYASSINCNDSTQIITNTNFNNGNYSYTWSPSTDLNNPSIANPYASPTSTTVYSVTVSNNGCSATTSIPINVIPLVSPEICMVSILNNKNIIIWDKPSSAIIDSFYVWRESSISGVYDKIGVTAYSDSSIFVDDFSNPLVQSNKYKISLKDNCELETEKSTIAHKTVHLSINQGLGNAWNLIWEPYEGFTVSTYYIYRGTVPDSLTLIGTTSGSSTQYTDNTAPSGYVYYQLQLVSPYQCNPSKSYENSFSNIATNDISYGIQTIDNLKQVKVYPNPVLNELIIEMNGNNEKVAFDILNTLGQVVFKGNIVEKTTVQTSNFTSGVYVIKLDNGGIIEFKKFVKE